ncbi:BrnA antitoxin family protein [Oleispirillum naphthae]|uniref:BrnA antitoxin family protein n=1 Tax=Oleispirillum naphthae TaxID=2838853 RepID=UPI003082689E
MTGKSKDTRPTWVDPDDAPELTEEMFEKGVWKIGDREVDRAEGQAAASAVRRGGRPRAESPKKPVNIRLDPDVLAHFKATGPGWQTRINDALRKAAKLPKAG